MTATITAPGRGTRNQLPFPGEEEGLIVRLFVDGVPAGWMFQPNSGKVELAGFLKTLGRGMPKGSTRKRWEWLVLTIPERWNELGIGELDELIVG